MLANGILQYPVNSVVATVPQATVIINNSYPIFTYAEPKLNDINFREYFTSFSNLICEQTHRVATMEMLFLL